MARTKTSTAACRETTDDMSFFIARSWEAELVHIMLGAVCCS